MRPAQILAILNGEFLSTETGHHTPVMLWGPPGVGKSQIIQEIGRHHSAPVIDIRLSQMEPSDLRGIPFRKDESVEWAAAAYQLILDRRLGEYQVPDGWAIFAAGNRQGDRGVTYSMPAPLANRFSHLDFETHLDDWVLWAYKNNIDERVIAFLRFRPELLFDFDPAHNPVAFPSPRSWEFAHRALQKFEHNSDLLLGSLQACVGPAAGIELKAFVDNLDNLPDIDAITTGDESVPVPTETDLQYAVAAALVGRSIRAQESDNANEALGHILNYAGRFPQREMGVMLVSDMHRAIGEKIFAVPQFSQWAKNVADVMLYDA
jgi:hypothetical protein